MSSRAIPEPVFHEAFRKGGCDFVCSALRLRAGRYLSVVLYRDTLQSALQPLQTEHKVFEAPADALTEAKALAEEWAQSQT